MSAAEWVWAVSRGSYSDYRVLCICPDERTAKAVAQHVNDSGDGYGYDAAEVEQIPYITEPKTITTYGMSCEVWDNGTTSETRDTIRRESSAAMLWPEYNRPVHKRWVRAPIHNNRGGRLEVHGTDLERVRRVFSDTRARLITDDALRARREFTS